MELDLGYQDLYFLTASSAAVLCITFFFSCSCWWLFLSSIFVQFWLDQSPIYKFLGLKTVHFNVQIKSKLTHRQIQ